MYLKKTTHEYKHKMLIHIKSVADIAVVLEAAFLVLAKPGISLAMRHFGLVVPGVGTLHYTANNLGVAALLQTVQRYVHTHPVSFFVAPAAAASIRLAQLNSKL